MNLEVKEFELKKDYFTITSGLYPLGPSRINRIINAVVPESYSNPEPLEDIKRIARVDGSTLVFVTAAKNYVFNESEKITYFISLGIKDTGKHAGRTINIAVFLREPLSFNSLVELIKVITEAKCGALMDFGLKITGTVTDAVAAGTLNLVNDVVFAGTATPIGSEVGKIVYDNVIRLLKKDIS